MRLTNIRTRFGIGVACALLTCTPTTKTAPSSAPKLEFAQVSEPKLTLSLSHGRIEDPFETPKRWVARIPIGLQQLGVIPHYAAGEVRIAGVSVASGATWLSPTLTQGDHDVQIELRNGDRVERQILTVRASWRVSSVDSPHRFGLSDFGAVLRLSSDGQTLMVGAPEADHYEETRCDDGGVCALPPNFGAIDTFRRHRGVWSLESSLESAVLRKNFLLGASLALSERSEVFASQATTIVDLDCVGYRKGLPGVALFSRSGDAWQLQSVVSESNPGQPDRFGESLALSADGKVLAVGTPGDGAIADAEYPCTFDGGTGAVHMFARTPTEWLETAKLTGPGLSNHAEFGATLALSADGRVLAVGAPGDSRDVREANSKANTQSALASGAAFVFELDGQHWQQRAYLKASDARRFDTFGAVALSADGNTLVVGAQDEGHTSSFEGGYRDCDRSIGALYVFQREGPTWREQSKLKPASIGEHLQRFTLSADGKTIAYTTVGCNSVKPQFVLGLFHRFVGGWLNGPRLNPPEYTGWIRGAISLSADGTSLAWGDTIVDGKVHLFEALGVSDQ